MFEALVEIIIEVMSIVGIAALLGIVFMARSYKG